MEIKATKARPYLNVYLVLKRENQVCLLLRQNTGFCDNQWGLISGHAETDESATSAMIREAKEEAGIVPQNLQVVHVLHSKSNRENLDVFFATTVWKGDLINMEPLKCGGLEFFPLNQLPFNTIDYVAIALKNIQSSIFYDERGWALPTL